MGDTCCLPFSMGAIEAMIVDAVPGAYVTSLMVGKNEAEDEKNGKGALRCCWKLWSGTKGWLGWIEYCRVP